MDAGQKKLSAGAGRRKKVLLVALVVVVLAAVGLTIGAFVARYATSLQLVPSAVAKQAKAPILVPHDLPGKFQLSSNSFGISEDTLLFQAFDGVGGKLAFTEQSKPANLNFDDLYTNQFDEVKTLSDVPYASVWGKTKDKKLVLSVVSDQTWLLMTTSAPLGEADMQRITRGLKPYQP